MFDMPLKARNQLFDEAKWSGKLRMALEDLRAAEAHPLIKVNMNYWFIPLGKHRRQCMVCLGGAVLVGSFGVALHDKDGEFVAASHYNEMVFLDCIRKGLVRPALRRAGIPMIAEFDDWKFFSYEGNKEKWHRSMDEAVSILDRNGY